MGKNYLNKKEKIADYCELPKDILLGVPILSLTGNRELRIDNLKKVLEVSTEQIRILCKDYIICICGEDLQILLYTKDELNIYGRIKEITFN
ncbi:MAG: YabP/YqfC family sporulation protein [Lachnospiraceae bacterium]|nr:YabP/YqfC family sporulation protein [Lachnospiraceae bacterium]